MDYGKKKNRDSGKPFYVLLLIYGFEIVGLCVKINWMFKKFSFCVPPPPTKITSF